MIRLLVTFKEWRPGTLPDVLAACGAERLPDMVVPQLRMARAVVTDGVEADAVIAALLARGAERAYPDPVLRRSPRAAVVPHGVATNDPLDQWHLKRIGAYSAWRFTKGSPAIRQGALDSGYLPHPDLDPPVDGINVVEGVSNGDNLNPYTERGYDVHGACVHSVMAMKHGNGIGGAGVSPDAPFVHVAAMTIDPEYYLTFGDYIASLVAAVDIGCKVINNSNAMGIDRSSTFYAPYAADMEAAILHAWTSGALIVPAAGNEGVDITTFLHGGTDPVEWLMQEVRPDLMLVTGAIERDDLWASWNGTAGSNFGPPVSITAPGKGISAIAAGIYPLQFGLIAGTSFAAPIVSSGCVLVWSVNPDFTNAQVREIILSTVDAPISTGEASYRVKFPTQGILNIARAVTKARSMLAANAGVPLPCVTFPQYQLTTVVDGVPQVTLDSGAAPGGSVVIDLAGYADGAAVPRIVIDLGGTTIYDGPPARLTGAASASGTAKPLTVRAYTAAGAVSEETYSNVTVSSLSVASADGPVRQVKDRAGNAGVLRDRSGNAGTVKAR